MHVSKTRQLYWVIQASVMFASVWNGSCYVVIILLRRQGWGCHGYYRVCLLFSNVCLITFSINSLQLLYFAVVLHSPPILSRCIFKWYNCWWFSIIFYPCYVVYFPYNLFVLVSYDWIVLSYTLSFRCVSRLSSSLLVCPPNKGDHDMVFCAGMRRRSKLRWCSANLVQRNQRIIGNNLNVIPNTSVQEPKFKKVTSPRDIFPILQPHGSLDSI